MNQNTRRCYFQGCTAEPTSLCESCSRLSCEEHLGEIPVQDWDLGTVDGTYWLCDDCADKALSSAEGARTIGANIIPF